MRPVDHVKKAYDGFENCERLTGIPAASLYTNGRPKEKGGSDGMIPIRRAARLYYDALDRGLPLSWDDLRPSREAVGAAAPPERADIPVTVLAVAAAAFSLPTADVFETPADHAVRGALACALCSAFGWPAAFIATRVQLAGDAEAALEAAYDQMDADALFRVQVMLIAREARLSAAALLGAGEADGAALAEAAQ